MRALAWRQAVAAVRLPAVWIATVMQVAALAVYLLVWGDGIPLVDARPPFDQFVTAQSILLLLVLPWVAARCTATPHADDVATLAVLSARPPSTIVIGACVGLSGVACAVAITGLPLAIVSQQISDSTARELVAAQLRLLLLGTCAGTLTPAAVLLSGSRIAGWILSTLAIAGVMVVVPADGRGAIMIAAVAGSVAAALAQRAGQVWRYRMETRA